MSFSSGTVSYRQYKVIGSTKRTVDQEMIEKLAEHTLKPTEIGVPEEEEWGWSGGRHILDGVFSFEHNVFNDCLCIGLRIDTNKFPAALKKAYQQQEEDAVAKQNPSGFLSKNQKTDVKDTVRRMIEDELKTGKHRKSKLVSVLWDLPNRMIYSPATGKAFEKLADLFERTFGASLQPVTSGSEGLGYAEISGARHTYEGTRPTRFAMGPAGDGQHPEYPWVTKGAEPKDFLGNEFLLWLWHEADAKSGVIKTGKGDIAVLVDRQLDLDCSYGQTGRDGLKGDGPGRMPEAVAGLRAGKVPRKIGLVLDISKHQYALTLSGESLAVSGLTLPDVEEADTPRVLFEERITLLRNFSEGLQFLFFAFMDERLSRSSPWDTKVSDIRRHFGSRAAVATTAA